MANQKYKTPQHKNPTQPERTALAPYNFVPVPSRVIALPDDNPNNFLLVDQDRYHKNRRHGWIDVTLVWAAHHT